MTTISLGLTFAIYGEAPIQYIVQVLNVYAIFCNRIRGKIANIVVLIGYCI